MAQTLLIEDYSDQRRRRLGRWPACLSRSISWVHVSPSAYARREFFLQSTKKRFGGKRESVSELLIATFDENRRAVGTLNGPYVRQKIKARIYRGGGRRVDTCDHGFAQKIVEGEISYELGWKVKAMMEKKKKKKKKKK